MKWYFFFFSHYLQPSHVKCPFSDLVNYSVGASLQDISRRTKKEMVGSSLIFSASTEGCQVKYRTPNIIIC